MRKVLKGITNDIVLTQDMRKKEWKTLDIDKIQVGDKVQVLHRDGVILNGYEHDKEKVEKYLKINTPYTIGKIDIRDWTTDIYLKEVQDTWPTEVTVYFNSVNLTKYVRNRKRGSGPV